MIKAIVFDMDGVIIDSEPLYQKAQIKFFATYGVTVLPEHWKLFRGSTEPKFYELAKDLFNIDEPLDQLMPKGREYVLHMFEQELEFCDGFHELMGRIEDSYQLGLVTSSPRDIFDWIDKRLNVATHFEHILYGEMTINHKPHPEPYITMFKRLGVAPSEAIVIEDSIHGLNAAVASGAWTVAITGSVKVEDMPPSHALIESLHEIDDRFVDTMLTRRINELVS